MMKLNYEGPQGSAGNESKLVLRNNAHRIEFHLCRLDQDLCTLIILAGQDQQAASRCKQQGPFHAWEQALGAVNAISNTLISQGYQRSIETAIWQLQAQAQLKNNRNVREENSTNSDFVPLGLMPDAEF